VLAEVRTPCRGGAERGNEGDAPQATASLSHSVLFARTVMSPPKCGTLPECRNGVTSHLVLAAHPTVEPVAGLGTFVEVGHLDLAEVVGRKVIPFGVRVNAEELGGVEAEDLLFDLSR
jgi:hypothetical protein